MIPTDCAYEDLVTSAVLSGTWPQGCDEELVAHAESCEICSEVAMVATVLRADHEYARREVQVPVAGQVWWRSAVRARLESAQAATRPMAWLYSITAAITVGVALAAVGMAWPAVSSGLESARTVFLPILTNGEVTGAVAGVLRHSVELAFIAAVGLVLAPLVLYFVLSSD